MAENYFGITDTGRQRQNNEDTFIAEAVLKDKFIAACVIDGVGGYEGGEVAAAIARSVILDHFITPAGDINTQLQQAFISANEKIILEKQKDPNNSKMACVVTLALVERNTNKFYYAHIGDTRLYLLRDNSLVKITKDHSFIGFLEDTGRLKEEQAMAHPKRNEINKALGFETPITTISEFIETGESPFLPGDLILLCSDGLTDMIDKKMITSILTSNTKLKEKGKALVDAANNAGGKDNITVVLVQNDQRPAKQTATKPVQSKKYLQNGEVKNMPGEDEKNFPEKKTTNKRGLILFLSLVSILSLGALFYQLFKKNNIEKVPVSEVGSKISRNKYEQKLNDTLKGIGNFSLLLSSAVFDNTIQLTDTLLITKDSVHIRGDENTILSAVSSPTSPVIISPSVKYILFDSLTIQNINFFLMAQNIDVLHFNNVRFQNAHVYIINQFRNSSFSGSVKDMEVIDKDSLVINTNQ